MNKFKLETQVIFAVLGAFLLVIIGLIFIILTSQLKLNSEIWGPISTFGGALIGAIITGAIAINVNINDNKKRELYQKEIGEKSLKIIKHYINLIEIEYKSIQDTSKKLNGVYNPYSEIESEIVNGEEIITYFPPDIIIKEYEKEIQPFIDTLKFSAQNILVNFEKMEQVSIADLDMVSLDNYLNLIKQFKTEELLNVNKMIETDNPYRGNKEVGKIINLLRSI